jgi:hypothetical protein
MSVLAILEIIIAISAFTVGVVGLIMFDMPFYWSVFPFLSGLVMAILAIGNITLG